MSHALSPAARLRARWRGGGVVTVAGAHDAFGALLALEAGAEAIWSSGFEISTSHGVPDASILTMSEYLAAAASIAQRVAPVPVIADCDTGYGSSANVIRMVQAFEGAGVAAVCIEDKPFPKTNSFIPGRQALAPVSEFVGKLLAAKNAQRDPDFAVIARTEALIAGWGVDEALRRCAAYVRAGADAILVHDKDPAGAGVRAFMARWTPSVPVIVVPTTYPAFGVADCEALGISTIIWANQGIRAAATAIAETWRAILADGHAAGVEPRIAPMRRLFDLQGMPAHTATEQAFAPGAAVPTRAVLLHAGAHAAEATLAPLTAQAPLAALDLNGQALLARQVTTLHACGITDITVVAGHRAEQLPAVEATRVVNRDWATTGEVGSLLEAPLPDDEHRTLVCYGDVIVQPELLRRLLHAEGEVIVVADRHLSPDARDPLRIAAELGDARLLIPEHPRPVTAIGTAVPEPNAEFAGLVLLSAAARRTLQRTADPAQSLPDALAPLHPTALVVASGWLELRSLAHYEAACRQVAR